MKSADLKRLEVLVPPLPEQIAIAIFLDGETARIDALIAQKQRQMLLLQEKLYALISHAVIRGLDSDAPVGDSSIDWFGNVPAHWRTVQLPEPVKPSETVGAR